MKYLSLHHSHDSSITAFEDNNIVLHFELERHFNIKHFHGGLISQNDIGEAVDVVLAKLKWDHEAVDALIFTSLVKYANTPDWTGTEFEPIVSNLVYSKDVDNPYVQWTKKWRGKIREVAGILHHVNHMASSYYTSPYDDCLLFSIDGMGDYGIYCTYGRGVGSKIQYLGNTTWDNPLGLPSFVFGIVYSSLGHLFPFLGKCDLSCAGKAMGLSSYGKPVESWRDDIRDILIPDKDILSNLGSQSDAWKYVKGKMLRHVQKKILELRSKIDLDYNNPHDQGVQNLMATIQDESEACLCNSIERLVEFCGKKPLCLSGGCALNCQANTRLLQERVVDKLHIPPACSDSGLSIGAGLYWWHHIKGNGFSGVSHHSPYLGAEFTLNELDLNSVSLREDDLLDEVSSKLIAGAVIAWVQDRSEIGPRALGNRSILAMATPATMKEKVNRIKHREFWRPFAPICLEEKAREWFEIDHNQPYMLECPSVLPDKKELIPAVTHVDGTARLQTVGIKDNPLLYKLLKCVYDKSGVPVLLNTSLNDRGKPISNDSKTVLNFFTESELDFAVIGNRLYSKPATGRILL